MNSLTMPANDSRIYHTEYNWYVNKTIGFIKIANPGAYIKVNFTGSYIGIERDSRGPTKWRTAFESLDGIHSWAWKSC